MAIVGGSAATEPGLTEVLGGLRMLVAQLRLYPKTSAQVTKVASTASQGILNFLASKQSLTIASAPEGLLINAVRFTAADPVTVALEASTLALLREAGVKSFTFRVGINQEEVISFLHALAHKFWDLRDGKKINLRLREERVINVAVDEVEYVELGKDDLVLKEAVPKLEAAGFDVDQLLKTIDERLEVAIEHGKGPEARLGILKKMLEQDPTLLSQLMKEGAPVTNIGDAPGLLTFDKALETIRGIWKVMATASAESREALRKVAEGVLESFKGNKTLSSALGRALSTDAPELIPDWMREDASIPPEPSSVARARTIIFLSPEARAEAILREGQALVKDLVAIDRMDLVEQLLGLASAPLEEDNARKKAQAARTLSGWHEIFDSEPLAKGCEALRKQLTAVLDKEREAPVYAKLVELAAMLLESQVQKHGKGGGQELLDTLKRHSVGSDPGFPERSSLASAVLPKDAFGPAAGAVPAVPLSKSAADRVAAALHSASIQFLIAQMKNMENSAERLELAETVSRMGSNAAELLTEELKKSKIPSETIRLLEVLPWVAGAELAEQTLAGMLSHPVVMVRRRAGLALVERKYPQSESLLLEAFDTKEPSSRIAFAEALGRLGTDAALAKLRSAADSKEQPDDVRGACCQALGFAGDPKALQLLTTLSAAPSRGLGLTRIFSKTNPALRAAAAKALGFYKANEEIKALLDRLANDPEEVVKAAAKEALKPTARVKVTTGATPSSSNPPAVPAEGIAEPKQEVNGFSGIISEIALDQICQVIGNSKMTGQLLVNFEGPTATIFFDKGLVVSADFEGKKDQEAFNTFFPLKEGAFVFKPGERTLEPRMKSSVDQVLVGAFGASNSADPPPSAGAA